MNKHEYPNLGETLYEEVLPNGLSVLVAVKPGFRKNAAFFATRYGGADRRFKVNGEWIDTPAGVAHFLEHKMFDMPDGRNVLSDFAALGASPNAFTGTGHTAYYFTGSENFMENLRLLLTYVSTPYYTEESVAKEQGIIGQEICMGEDSPGYAGYFQLLSALYDHHPIRENIAGSVESIAQITPEILYACTDAFYRPQNMVLAVAGNVTMDEVLAACARADIPVKTGTVERIAPAEGPDVAEPYREFSMAVAKPLLGVGFKETPPAGDALKTEIICDMLTELICGSMTPLYRRLYDEGLVSPGFSGEILSLPGALSFLFGGETPEPETVRGLLLDEIARLKREGVDEELFTLCKNQLYGELVQDLENIEDVAGALASSFFRGRTPADEIETLASVTLSDVNGALRAMLCTERSATVIIRPAQ